MGRLTYNGTGSILNPASWSKVAQPVFQAGNGVVGVGHASFTKSPDGTEDWIVYHAHRNPPAPAGEEIRDIRIQRFTYFANGTPNFGAPLPLIQTIIAPSSGPDPQRLFVQGDYNADLSVGVLDYGTWRATYSNFVFNGVSADGSSNGVVDSADYVIWRKRAMPNGGGSEFGSSATTQMGVVPTAITIDDVQKLSFPAVANYAQPILRAAFDDFGQVIPPLFPSRPSAYTGRVREVTVDQVVTDWQPFNNPNFDLVQSAKRSIR